LRHFEICGIFWQRNKNKIRVFAVRSVVLGRVINFDLGFHKRPQKRMDFVPDMGTKGKP